MLDLIVRGGLVVTQNGTHPFDIAAKDGRIVAVGAPEALNGLQAGRTLDARGRIVIPGGIDPHIRSSDSWILCQPTPHGSWGSIPEKA